MYKKIFIFLIVLMMTFVSGNVFSDDNFKLYGSNDEGWAFKSVVLEGDNLNISYLNKSRDRSNCDKTDQRGLFLIFFLTENKLTQDQENSLDYFIWSNLDVRGARSDDFLNEFLRDGLESKINIYENSISYISKLINFSEEDSTYKFVVDKKTNKFEQNKNELYVIEDVEDYNFAYLYIMDHCGWRSTFYGNHTRFDKSEINLAKAFFDFSEISSDEVEEKLIGNCGEGTIKDTENNLCWEQNLNRKFEYWDSANEICNNLKLGGHNDWSLPTGAQLETLLKKGQSTNNCDNLKNIGFINCEDNNLYITKDKVKDPTNNLETVQVVSLRYGSKQSVFLHADLLQDNGYFVCVRELEDQKDQEGKDTTESVERPTEDVLTENYFRKLSIEFNPEIYNQNIVCETTVNNICYVRSSFRNLDVNFKVNNSSKEVPLYIFINELTEDYISKINLNYSNPISNLKLYLGDVLTFKFDQLREFSIPTSSVEKPYFLVVRQANAVSDFIYFIPVSDDEFEKVLKYKLLQKILNKSYCIGCEIPDWIRESGIDLRDTEVCEDVDKCVPLTPKKEDPVDEDYICEEKIVRINIDGVERMEPISICSIPTSGIPEIEIVSREICDLRIRSPFNIDPMTPMPSCLISIDDNLYRPIEIREITTPKIPEKDLKDICSDFLDTEDDLIDCFTYFDVDMKLSVVDLETSSSGYIGADLDPEKTYRFYFNQRYNSLNTSIQNIQSRAVYSYFTEVTNFFNMSDNEKAMFFALIGGESSFLSNQKGDLKEGTTDQYQSFGPAQININVWVREGKNYVTSEPNVIKYLNEYFKGNNLSEITTNQEYLTFANTVKENDKNGLILGAAVFLDYLDKIRANPNLQKYLMEGNEYSLEYVNVNLAFILFYGHQIGYPNAKFVIDRFQIPENNKILEIADRQSTENNNKLNRVAAYGGLQKLAWYIFYLDHFDVDFYD